MRDLLAEDSLAAVRRRSLEQGMAVARQRRRRATWAKGGMISVLLVATICVLRPARQRPSGQEGGSGQPAPTAAILATVAPATRNSAVVRFISDEELLGLFPGRSLALIDAQGHKELVFLRESLEDDRDQPGLPGAMRRGGPKGAE